MIIELLQFFIDSLGLVKDSLDLKDKSKKDLESGSLLLCLYASLSRFSVNLGHIEDIPTRTQKERYSAMRDFFDELDMFGKYLGQMNKIINILFAI